MQIKHVSANSNYEMYFYKRSSLCGMRIEAHSTRNYNLEVYLKDTTELNRIVSFFIRTDAENPFSRRLEKKIQQVPHNH